MRDIRLIPYMCSAGGQVAGSELAALDLSRFGMHDHLRALGLPVAWLEDPEYRLTLPYGAAAHENLPPLGSAARKEIVLANCRQVRQDVMRALSLRALPVTIGGDHAMALGSISAVAEYRHAAGRTGVIWIDAHPDFNTPQTSPSQAIHGMPLAALCGLGDEDYVGLAGSHAVLNPRDIVYIGIRSIDPGEADYIRELGMNAFTMDEVNRLGFATVMDEARKIACRDTGACVMSIDLDAFDPVLVPAVGSPVPDGLSPDEAMPVLEAFAREAPLDLLEIAEYNPALKGEKTTRLFIEKLLSRILPGQARLDR